MIKTDQYELMWKELKVLLQEAVIYGNCIQYGICSGLIEKMEKIEEKHKEPNK
jgi:uncharacterized protein YqgQ